MSNEKETVPARLDEKGDAKPLTQLVKHERANGCVNGVAHRNQHMQLREEGKETVHINPPKTLGELIKAKLEENQGLNHAQTDALESIRLARMALNPAIRNRHSLVAIKPYSALDGYTQVCRIEALLDDLIGVMEKKNG